MTEWRNRIVATGDEAPDQLLANPKNFRRHPKHQQEALRGVLNEVGWVQDVIVNRTTGRLVDGHLRVELALRDGAATVPVKYVELSDAEESLILATFDPISALATADKEQLDALLREVSTGEAGVQQMLADLAEREGIVGLGGGTDGLTDADEVPEPPAEPVSRPGDLWVLGEHRVLCGDSTSAADVARLMNGERADICFTSPPYASQRTYGGDLAPWDDLMQGVFSILPMSERGQVLVNLGLVHEKGEWIDYWSGWLEFMRSLGWRRFGWYVWDQGSGLPGDWNGRLAPSHEFVFHFNRESVSVNKITPSKMAGKKKTGNGLRGSDDVVSEWTHAGRLVQPTKVPDSVIRINRHSSFVEAVEHPAVFPVAFAAEVIGAFSQPGNLQFDPFLGSGSALIAAVQVGRRCFGMEIHPKYVDVIVQRWEAFTGRTAELHRSAEAAD